MKAVARLQAVALTEKEFQKLGSREQRLYLKKHPNSSFKRNPSKSNDALRREQRRKLWKPST